MSRRDPGTGSLFPEAEPARDERPRPDAPLADRVRPRTLDEVLGQDEVLGPGKPLRRAIEQDQLRSLILWGPPGSGKTTLALVIRRLTRAHFESMSAVLSGVKELREVLKPPAEADLVAVLRKALSDVERGLGSLPSEVTDEALVFLARAADGDARTALNVLELAVTVAVPGEDGRRPVDLAAMQQAFARKALLYDRAGEEHFNLISALHKSIRNSDADAGLYWLARMLEAGEGPLYGARPPWRVAP